MDTDFIKRLKDFCFDVLGDIMELDAYVIEEQRGGPAVFIRYPGKVYCTRDEVVCRWAKRKAGTEFEKVLLYIPV